jgi:hypothetical protein
MPRHNRQRFGRVGDRRWGSPRKRPPERDNGRGARRRSDREAEPLELFLSGEESPDTPNSAPPARTCGRCREWFPHPEGGRGNCAHPGSGFLFPWADTPACPFFTPLR